MQSVSHTQVWSQIRPAGNPGFLFWLVNVYVGTTPKKFGFYQFAVVSQAGFCEGCVRSTFSSRLLYGMPSLAVRLLHNLFPFIGAHLNSDHVLSEMARLVPSGNPFYSGAYWKEVVHSIPPFRNLSSITKNSFALPACTQRIGHFQFLSSQ